VIIVPLSHVIKKRLPINISVLSDLVDNTCAQIIYARQGVNGSIGDTGQRHIMIPKSWLHKGVTPIGSKDMDFRLIWSLVESLGELLCNVSIRDGITANGTPIDSKQKLDVVILLLI
jgi:hypothetical protein